jgi:hypothetical protein
MAALYNEQRVLGVRIVADGTKLHNNQPVIGVVATLLAVKFVDNKRTLGVDVLPADAAVHNEQPVIGVVVIGDGRKLYNDREVIPVYAVSGVL